MDDPAPTKSTPRTNPAAPAAGEDRFTLVPVTPRVPVLSLGLVLVAVLATWLLGHLPWVLDGFRTAPESDLAGTSSEGLSGVRMPIGLIAGQLTELVAFTAIGAVVAMLLPPAFNGLPRPLAVVVAGLTLAGTTLFLTLASRSAIANRAADGFADDERVLGGLVVGVFAVAALAGFLGCLASVQVGFLPLATAVLVGQLPSWFGALGADPGTTDVLHPVAALVLLTAAFAISVRRSVGWIVLWPVAWAIVWTAAPLGIATNRMQDRLRPGAGLNSENLSDVFADAFDLFGTTFWQADQTWWPGVLAAVIALVWLVGTRRRAGVAG